MDEQWKSEFLRKNIYFFRLSEIRYASEVIKRGESRNKQNGST